jgi:hypothetical protein
MPKNKKNTIDYTSREFDSIKRDLERHARLYYPDSYRDFSENSFGSYVTDTVSYIGDMLSFYIDYQVNESFLDTALEYSNVQRLTRNMGYKTDGRPAAFGMATFYISVPASLSGVGPNLNYIPILKAGAEVNADNGTSFVLLEDVDFSNPKNEVVASRFSSASGKPTEYAIRAYGQIKSTALYRVEVEVESFVKFRRIRVGSQAIQEIKSVVDSSGHEYYEVENLSQDTIYINTTNANYLSDGVPEIIKPKIIKRRFVVERDATGTYLRFGDSSESDDEDGNILDPSQAVLKMSGKNYISDNSFDPSKLLNSKTLGVSPIDTTLTILFYQNSSDSINVAAGEIKNMTTKPLVFSQRPNDLELQTIRNSLEVSNDEPIVGATSVPSSEELKYRAYAHRSSQSRSVTRNDYESIMYLMPSKFGSVKRAAVINDPSSSNRRLSVYVISEDSEGNLITSNSTIKNNLKIWLNEYKMLNDNIDIYDAKIINIGFDYEIIVDPTKDKTLILNQVQQRLGIELSDKMYIGEPFYLTNIFNIINKVDGVVDTTKVTPILKTGTGYSSAPVGIDDMKSEDGTYLKAPRNVIFEIKNFNTDVRGSAK